MQELFLGEQTRLHKTRRKRDSEGSWKRQYLLLVSLRAHGRFPLSLLFAVQAVVDRGEGPTHQRIASLSRLPTGVHPESQRVLLLPERRRGHNLPDFPEWNLSFACVVKQHPEIGHLLVYLVA